MAIELIAKIKPKNNGTFPLVDAEDIAYGESRLPEILAEFLTQEQYEEIMSAIGNKADTGHKHTSTEVDHTFGEENLVLSEILNTYILNIDYKSALSFDTNEIVVGSSSSSDDPSDINNPKNAVLDHAILDTMVLA